MRHTAHVSRVRSQALNAAMLGLLASAGASMPLGCGTVPEQAPPDRQEAGFDSRTFAYKTIGETGIEADVYRADDEVTRPVVVWIHGGALIFGSRANPPRRLLDLCRVAGFVLVSIDYRLAPDVELPSIIEELEDAFDWIRQQGPELFHADPDRLVVAGGSAGGYLTMASGIRVTPQPTALVTYWGYGALDNSWYTEPSEFYRSSAPLVSEEEAYGEGNLYLYLRQNGLWTQVVTGFDPAAERHLLDPYTPVRNITSEYPPILMIHGTNDTDVPYEESVGMAEQLAQHEVPHELILVPEGGHGLGGADRELITDAHNRAVRFIHRYLAGETRAQEIEPLLAAFTTLDEGIALARAGNIAEARDAYARAQALEPKLSITTWAWYTLCWNGSVHGFAADVMSACDRAIDQAPGLGRIPWIRDARGIARALTDDIEGALEDLEAFLAAEIGSAEVRAQRQEWVAALRAGENPFTSDVLESLRDG